MLAEEAADLLRRFACRAADWQRAACKGRGHETAERATRRLAGELFLALAGRPATGEETADIVQDVGPV